MTKKCTCPFDTPTDGDRVAVEDGWTVTYCGMCRGLVRAVLVSAGEPDMLPIHFEGS